MRKGFLIFCDESVKKDRHYSNFYGGALIFKEDYEYVKNRLNQTLSELEFEDSELKWSNINTHRVESYKKIISAFFSLIREGKIKVRIMFTDNRNVPVELTSDHKRKSYHLLYYQFIKHAFGFSHLDSDYPIDLELFFDILPQTKKSNIDFKKYIYGIQFLPELIDSNLFIKKDSIYEVDSKKHLILQCVDVVLGSIAFRLNDHHLDKPDGERRRGKRTLAKEKVYKHINQNIRSIKPNFNIGVSTSFQDQLDKFTDQYRHWIFVPKKSENIGGSKKRKRS
ncbi:DUF3800 domain-containing protein [Roseivirga spongicola]|uniref:DUF3800 domain-containing protein n=1 Tax=Roseivirga spongicola TaxID=333140 RepID=A0A150XI38_9BACT|nr:DUF3800 domain-containing protein [Roseivirga spongicola]KYG78400.1 hypothetical protein AWW68_06435 [Roseivirga spongicola]WPZ12148.1 DUF3800 domain-containing protein [Roseivirga spongicola]